MKFIIENGYVNDVQKKEFKKKDGTLFNIGKLCVREGYYDEETQYATSILHYIDFDFSKFDEVLSYKEKNVKCEGNILRSSKTGIDNSKTYYTNFRLDSIELV